MAFLITRPQDRYVVRFTDPHGRRREIYLGQIPERAANRWKSAIDELEFAKGNLSQIPASTRYWLEELDDKSHDKLSDKGLTQPRTTVTIVQMVQSYIDDSRLNPRKSTVTIQRYETQLRRLTRYQFCLDTRMIDLTLQDIQEARQRMLKDLKPNTVNKDMQMLAAAFDHNVELLNLAVNNPFRSRSIPRSIGAAEKHYITLSEAQAMIDAAPTWRWRNLIALCRYAGCRLGEALDVRWADIDFADRIMVVRSPKTAHQGKAVRRVTLHEPLSKMLEDCLLEYAEEGEDRVVPLARNNKLYAKIKTIALKAGLESLTKPFNAMRASCGTNLALAGIPLIEVAGHMGHTVETASRHYLNTAAKEPGITRNQPFTPTSPHRDHINDTPHSTNEHDSDCHTDNGENRKSPKTQRIGRNGQNESQPVMSEKHHQYTREGSNPQPADPKSAALSN